MHFNARSSVASDLQAGITDGMQIQAPVIGQTQVIDFSYHPGLAFLRMLFTIPCFCLICFGMRVLVV